MHRHKNNLALVPSLGWVFAGLAGAAAQSSHVAAPVSVPSAVFVYEDGAAQVVLEDVAPTALDRMRPLRVPVFEVCALRMRPGVRLRTDPSAPSTTIARCTRPLYVAVDKAGEAQLVTAMAMSSGKAIAPDVGLLIPGSEFIPVTYDGAPPDNVGCGPVFTVNLIIDQQSLPPCCVDDINLAAQRAAFRVEQLLSTEVNCVTANLAFVPTIPGELARTSVNHDSRTLGFATSCLENWAKKQNEPPAEISMYSNLPSGSMPVIFANGQTTSVSTVYTPMALLFAKWEPAAPAPVADIMVDNTAPFDYRAYNGVDTNPGKYDFEATIAHEIIHALGFTSLLEDPATDLVTVLDLFRLSNSQAGNGVSGTVYATAARMLQPGVEAVTVTAINAANLVYRMSTGEVSGGDTENASHWKRLELLGTYVGLMDPDGRLGEQPRVPGYLFTSDIRAIDLIGWDVRLGQGPQPPQANPLTAPPNGQQRVGFRPMLQWTEGVGATTHGVYVFSGTTPGEATLVHSAENLTGSSYTVPYGVLDESTTYSWRATAFNSTAFALSEVWTFSTRCYADCTADGNLTIADFGCFQSQFGKGNPEADCNESGTLTIADFGCFQARFDAGCP